jgi:hypothetical protein
LRNSQSIPAYKGQIYVYNLALKEIQGFFPKKGFILGKKWNFTKNGIECFGNNFFDKLGEIDYENRDKKFINQTNDALNWIRDVRLNGHVWKLLPYPTRKELFPNMKNERDGMWRIIKNDLNQKINEITSVWMCGVKRRITAHNKGIYSWKDNNCTAKNMNFKPNKTAKTLDSILNINRQNKELINIGSLNNDKNWIKKSNDILEFYLDYETMNSNFGRCLIENDNIGYKDNDFVFLIGIGWEEDSKWVFKEFLAESNSESGEFKKKTSFLEFCK